MGILHTHLMIYSPGCEYPYKQEMYPTTRLQMIKKGTDLFCKKKWGLAIIDGGQRNIRKRITIFEEGTF